MAYTGGIVVETGHNVAEMGHSVVDTIQNEADMDNKVSDTGHNIQSQVIFHASRPAPI